MALIDTGLNATNKQFIFLITSFPVSNKRASPTQLSEASVHSRVLSYWTSMARLPGHVYNDDSCDRGLQQPTYWNCGVKTAKPPFK